MTSSPHASELPLYDSAALRRLETLASGDDGFALMARAGQAAWRTLLRHWPQAGRIVVVCGPGNNGGAGYVLARHALAAGRQVRVLRLPGHAPRTALAARACRDYVDAGGGLADGARAFDDADLVVDALFGIGLQRAPEGDAAALIAALNAAPAPVFALDVPSGVDADRGHAPGVAVRAARTLQFIAPHAGLQTGAALEHVGSCEVAALDVPSACFLEIEPVALRLGASALRTRLPPRARNAHKGDSGHVLCIGGDSGRGGALLLAAEAALRCGAGLVSTATRAAHVPAMLARRPEAMAHAVADAAGLAPLLAQADVAALGPGLGQAPWGRELYAATLAAGVPLVLDADALNLLAAAPRPLPADSVLTPHPGEAARLLGMSAAQVQADRFAAVRRLCAQHGCTVVLKGAGTLVAAPGEAVRVIAAGNPGMAVGGMGDVLTGCIAALRAQGFPPGEAARLGALLHAAAGDAAVEAGERGLLPADLFPWLRLGANARLPA